uniref:RNase H type-1 domain-containing protein n=1 Tax=Cannabis sativa TaxID=3483 RepID=A0A803QGR4_CANSA
MAGCSSSFGLTHVVNFRNDVVSRKMWNQNLIKEVGFPLLSKNNGTGHIYLKRKERLVIMNMVESQGESQSPLAAITISKEDSESTVGKTGVFKTGKEEDKVGGGGYGEVALEEVMKETEARGVTLPSDMLEAAKSVGIRKVLLLRYLDLQGSSGILAFAMRSCSMLRNRMLADPAFLFKIGTEIVIDSCCATFAEVQKRGKDFWSEFELYVADLLVGTVVNVVLVGMLAPYVRIGQPNVSKGLLGRLQHAYGALPSSVFEAERPGCRFSLEQRIGTYFYKGIMYGAVGFGCGIIGQGIANLIMTAKRSINKSEEDIPVPPLLKSAALWGVFLAVSSNTRYQIVNGLERLVEGSAMAKQVPPVAMAFTVGVRFANNNKAHEHHQLEQKWLPSYNPDNKRKVKFHYGRPTIAPYAHRSHSPSMTCQGILWGRDLLTAGLRWKIGEGRTVRIGSNLWVPEPSSFLPLCYTGPEYATALFRQKVVTDAICSICKQAWESIGHAMFDCKYARVVWRCLDFVFDRNLARSMNKGDYLVHLSSIYTKTDMEFILCTMWSIWYERNNVVHGKAEKLAKLAFPFTANYLQNYHRARAKYQSPTATASSNAEALPSEPWQPPEIEILKLNVDATCDKAKNIIGIGAIIRDAYGRVIVAFSKLIIGNFTSHEMEAKALFYSLNLAIQLQQLIGQIETDALMVSNALNASFSAISSFKDLIVDITSLLSFFHRVSINHVKRSANMATHSLARYALELDETCSWLEDLPPSFHSVIVNDIS